MSNGLALAIFAVALGGVGGCSAEAANCTPQATAVEKTKPTPGGPSGGAAASTPSGFTSFHPDGDAKSYFSGFDGKNDFVTPIAFFADEPPTVTFGDPSVAELQGAILTLDSSVAPDLPAAFDGKIHVMLVKSKKAGRTNIHAVGGSVDQTAKLEINGYASDDAAIGERRYNAGANACNGCHAALAVHSTSMLADLSDETILGIAVEGKSLRQIDVQTGKAETLEPNGGRHEWQVTAAERMGLMAYLRSRSLVFQLPSSGSAK
jgi:hypothetical protein